MKKFPPRFQIILFFSLLSTMMSFIFPLIGPVMSLGEVLLFRLTAGVLFEVFPEENKGLAAGTGV